jgi:[ribosomal protein S5]-alanine N-acetyltransferase
MEKMPYRDRPGLRAVTPAAGDIVSSNWREQLPVLSGAQVELRELRRSDAPSLFAMLTSEEVARFISPPPTTLEGFENFIAWTHRQRSAGAYACFAVTLKGYDTAIGLFQVRELEPGFATAEWGFAIGSAFWGTGVFKASADLVLEFVFDTLGVHRLEARAAVRNGRGTGALRKTGAVQEGLLRKSFLRNGEYLDQVLYAILSDDWRAAREEGLNPRASLRIH